MTTIKLSGIITEDFVNYKYPALSLMFPFCTMKCNKDCGKVVCQNTSLKEKGFREYSIETIYQKYIINDITNAICCYGMEPMDSFEELLSLIKYFRENNCQDMFVIYTGYYKEEIREKITQLMSYKNIIIKFGRYIPNDTSHFDEVLGINLVSSNQYAEQIS